MRSPNSRVLIIVYVGHCWPVKRRARRFASWAAPLFALDAL